MSCHIEFLKFNMLINIMEGWDSFNQFNPATFCVRATLAIVD